MQLTNSELLLLLATEGSSSTSGYSESYKDYNKISVKGLLQQYHTFCNVHKNSDCHLKHTEKKSSM